jgi:Fic family protein
LEATWIHERADWPRFRWDDSQLAGLLATVRFRQGRLLGRLENLGFRLRQEASLASLTEDVVKSWAIEGESLDPTEVRSSIARHLGLDTAIDSVVSRDVDGVVEMTLDATQRFSEPLTADRLFAWHSTLFPTGRAGMHKIIVGAWRKGPMQVVSGPIGREKVHFSAPSANRLAAEMGAFLQWFEKPSAVNPVLRAGISHFWFVTIHPFDDGNGRIARAITDLALARADGTKERYYSISSQIEAERKAYYTALESQQRSDLDITPWLAWFIGCLGRATDAAQDILGGVLFRARFWEVADKSNLNERQQAVLARMVAGFEGHLNTSKYAKMAKCSSDTALRDVRDLLEKRLVVRNESGGRSTSYRLATLGELDA